jgi:nicotinamide mononucleotide transporter
MSVLEIIGVVVSAFAIWLTARRKMLCWPVGLVSVALYGWIFFDAKLYSDMLLQGAFAVLQIYGWWVWLGQKTRNITAESGEVRVQAVTPKALMPGLLLAVIGSVVLGTLMARLTDAALPYVDASLTAFSLVAQYWTARRFIASWWLWIVVDVVYVGMFVFKGLYPTSGLYALFVVLALIGLRDWSRAAARAEPAQTPHAA